MNKNELKVYDDKFEDFLCSRNDEIDNAVYSLMRIIQGIPDNDTETFPWNMNQIGDVELAIETTMMRHNLLVCFPGYNEDDAGIENDENENGIPCYRDVPEGPCTDCIFCKKENITPNMFTIQINKVKE